MGTLFATNGKNETYFIIPIDEWSEWENENKQDYREFKKKRSVTTEKAVYKIYKETFKNRFPAFPDQASLKAKKLEKNKKAFLTQNPAVPLYVETLIVTDVSIYESYASLSPRSNKYQLLSNMRIYFAYLINGV
jgi:hypothetical protein